MYPRQPKGTTLALAPTNHRKDKNFSSGTLEEIGGLGVKYNF